MATTLINKKKRKRTFILDHPFFDDQGRTMNMVVSHQTRDGRLMPKRIRKRVPGSMTLLAGEKRHGLPDQIIKVPQIAKAIREKTLVFLRVREETATAAAKSVRATTTTTTKKGEKKTKRSRSK